LLKGARALADADNSYPNGQYSMAAKEIHKTLIDTAAFLIALVSTARDMDWNERSGFYGRSPSDLDHRSLANQIATAIAMVASVTFTALAQCAIDPETGEPMVQRNALGVELKSYRGVGWAELSNVLDMWERIEAQVLAGETFRDGKSIRDVYGMAPNAKPVPPAPARHTDGIGYNDYRMAGNKMSLKWIKRRVRNRIMQEPGAGAVETKQCNLRRLNNPTEVQFSYLANIRLDVPPTLLASAVAVAAVAMERPVVCKEGTVVLTELALVNESSHVERV